MIFGFHYEDMEEIIESGDRQIGVVLLKIPINLFTLAEDFEKNRRFREFKKKHNPKEKVLSHICMHTIIQIVIIL